MGRAKIPIIACLILMLLITGILVFNKIAADKSSPVYADGGKASASSVIPGTNTDTINSGNYTYIPPTYEYDDNDENKEEDQMLDNNSEKTPWTPATEMDLDPASITVYVNKEYNLPKDYVPDDLVQPNIPFDTSGYAERKLLRKEAADAIEKLFEAANKAGYTLYGISGYRSYKRQKEIFLNNIIRKGKEHTLKYSAAPGTSEHQTGLAMDVSAKSVRYKLVTAFAYSDEGKWLSEHAHEYGFIIRYPKDRSEKTGYAYEPWHIRYVGKDLADYLYTNNLTLDEYYKYVPSKDFDYEKKYADLINYRPTVAPTPTQIPEDELDEDDFLDDILDELPEDQTEDMPDDVSDNTEDTNDIDDIEDDFSENEIPGEDNGGGSFDSDEDYLPDSSPAPTAIPSDNSGEVSDTVNENSQLSGESVSDGELSLDIIN